MQPRVMTVTGPLAPEQMGITDAHSHLWIAPVAGAAPGSPVLDGQAAIQQELLEYREAGGRSQIDCQPGGCGRDARRLHSLALESKVQVVASTGFHLRRYYPPEAPLWLMDEDQAAAYFMDEINAGLRETRGVDEARANGPVVYPGQIKIAVRESLGSSPLRLMEAAAQASLETGYAISMHTEKGFGVDQFLDFFLQRGVAPQRLIFCHVDKRPDFSLHADLARAGVLLEYDTFFRPKYLPEQNLWPLLAQMLEAGLERSLALATDMAEASLWHYQGGPGLAAFPHEIKRRLEAIPLEPEVVSRLMGGNITCRLAIADKE
jgi:predicted metal-dependent phosphotriesterase family hydrolase